MDKEYLIFPAAETRCEDPRGSKASGMSEQIDEEQRWVCPNDRQLCLRAKLNSGWSFHTSGPARKPASKNNISVSEQEIIRDVLERSERLRHIEEERVGRLVDKLENMHNSAIGDGRETCLLCNSKFGTLKVVPKRCDICEKNVCQKCGLDTHDSYGDAIWLCCYVANIESYGNELELGSLKPYQITDIRDSMKSQLVKEKKQKAPIAQTILVYHGHINMTKHGQVTQMLEIVWMVM